MPGPLKILTVGLTGGIASGKTTAAGFLAECGAYVIDADQLAHELMEPGAPAHRDVVARFGRGILDEGGRIDRAVLGPLVFRDPVVRRDLNALVHPRVLEEVRRRLMICARTGRAEIAVLDAALLVETGAHRELDRLVVVRCSPDTQIARLMERAGIGREAAEQRVAIQSPLETKLAVADYVIDTDTSLSETRRQTERVWLMLKRDFERL